MEAAPLVPLAGDGDGAPHLIHDVLGDGHTQAGALGALDPGAVLPGKGVEDLLLELFRHTDAGVPDDEVGADEVPAPGRVLLGHRHGDAPPSGVNFRAFVGQYDILDNKWGALLCQKGNQTRDTHQNSRKW